MLGESRPGSTENPTAPDAVDDSPVLICYDGSEGARNAITAAAALLVGPNEPPLP
jgi:hypothetical protein